MSTIILNFEILLEIPQIKKITVPGLLMIIPVFFEGFYVYFNNLALNSSFCGYLFFGRKIKSIRAQKYLTGNIPVRFLGSCQTSIRSYFTKLVNV